MVTFLHLKYVYKFVYTFLKKFTKENIIKRKQICENCNIK